jgi:hypothetical protein
MTYFCALVRFGNGFGNATEFELPCVENAPRLEVWRCPPMPASSKQALMLEEVACYHVQRKWARVLHIASQILNDLPPSSDTQAWGVSRVTPAANLCASSSNKPKIIQIGPEIKALHESG